MAPSLRRRRGQFGGARKPGLKNETWTNGEHSSADRTARERAKQKRSPRWRCSWPLKTRVIHHGWGNSSWMADWSNSERNCRNHGEGGCHDQSQHSISKQAGLAFRYELLPLHAHAHGDAPPRQGPAQDRGRCWLQGAKPGEPPAFFAGCQLYFDSIESFLEVWQPAAAELTADIPKYTDVAPIIQFNEVKLSL